MTQTYIVNDIVERNSISAVESDYAFVRDKGDGEWGYYIFDGSNWIIITSEETSKVDSRTISITIDYTQTTAAIIGEINGDNRVNLIVVDVISPFDDPSASLNIGDSGNSSSLMTNSLIDLSSIGRYETTPNYQYSQTNDEFIIGFLAPGASTMGVVNIAVTYS